MTILTQLGFFHYERAGAVEVHAQQANCFYSFETIRTMEDETGIQLPDLIITLAYFSIPMQILAALYQYPHLAKMPMKLVILLILFAL